MAAVTATVFDVVILRGDDTFNGSENNAYRTKIAHVFMDNNSTQVAGGSDTLDCNLATAIQNHTRNGKTVTPRAVSIIQTLQNSVNTFSGTISLSGSTSSITPKGSSNNDWSTNATITAVASTRPYGVSVTYTEA